MPVYQIIRHTDGQSVIVRAADGATIPIDPANTDYAAFIVQQAAGLVPTQAPSTADIIASVETAAQSICGSILDKVAPDSVRLTAYINAAAQVAASGGQTPSTDPIKTAFAQQASSYGLTPSAFATIATAVSAASMMLNAAFTTLHGALSTSASNADMQTAVGAFMSGIGELIGSINATPGIHISIDTPSPIKVFGLNA